MNEKSSFHLGKKYFWADTQNILYNFSFLDTHLIISGVEFV